MTNHLSGSPHYPLKMSVNLPDKNVARMEYSVSALEQAAEDDPRLGEIL